MCGKRSKTGRGGYLWKYFDHLLPIFLGDRVIVDNNLIISSSTTTTEQQSNAQTPIATSSLSNSPATTLRKHAHVRIYLFGKMQHLPLA